jgi:hypothetical protein
MSLTMLGVTVIIGRQTLSLSKTLSTRGRQPGELAEPVEDDVEPRVTRFRLYHHESTIGSDVVVRDRLA